MSVFKKLVPRDERDAVRRWLKKEQAAFLVYHSCGAAFIGTEGGDESQESSN